MAVNSSTADDATTTATNSLTVYSTTSEFRSGFGDCELLRGGFGDGEFQCRGFGDDELLGRRIRRRRIPMRRIRRRWIATRWIWRQQIPMQRGGIRRRRITLGGWFGDGELLSCCEFGDDELLADSATATLPGLFRENIGETLLLRHNVQILQTGGSMLKNATVVKTTVPDLWHF